MVKLKKTDELNLIPENELVNVRVSNIEMREFTFDNEKVEKLRWEFVVVDPGPWEGKNIFGDTSTNFTAHPNCKAYNWSTAITGKQFDVGEELDTDNLLGLPCRVIIMHKPDREGRSWMRVREVLPARTGTEGIGAGEGIPSEAPF